MGKPRTQGDYWPLNILIVAGFVAVVAPAGEARTTAAAALGLAVAVWIVFEIRRYQRGRRSP